jgi:RNA polymerase sigma-70 factor (ECF subfamily)
MGPPSSCFAAVVRSRGVKSPTTEKSEQALVRGARGGDRAAFEELCRDALPKLRGIVRKMVGHAAQTDDLVQEALTKAWTSLASFDGRSAFGTWLCRIGMNLAIDFLRGEKRWRDRAQVAYANECAGSEELGTEVGAVLTSSEFRYDVREHIAFCFVCVARSLSPDLQAALVLREVEGLSNQEAADQLGITESVLRHRVSDARARMEASFDGLCALVNKRGVCYQCSGLREGVPDPARQGDPAPDSISLVRRLQVVSEVDVDRGIAQPLHDLFWRRIADQERQGTGSTEPASSCAPKSEPRA